MGIQWQCCTRSTGYMYSTLESSAIINRLYSLLALQSRQAEHLWMCISIVSRSREGSLSTEEYSVNSPPESSLRARPSPSYHRSSCCPYAHQVRCPPPHPSPRPRSGRRWIPGTEWAQRGGARGSRKCQAGKAQWCQRKLTRLETTSAYLSFLPREVPVSYHLPAHPLAPHPTDPGHPALFTQDGWSVAHEVCANASAWVHRVGADGQGGK